MKQAFKVGDPVTSKDPIIKFTSPDGKTKIGITRGCWFEVMAVHDDGSIDIQPDGKTAMRVDQNLFIGQDEWAVEGYDEDEWEVKKL